MKLASSLRTSDAAAVTQPLTVIGPVSVDRVREAQRSCPAVSNVIKQLESDTAVTVSEFKKVCDQLVMEGDLLCRNVKLPLEGTVFVPVIPETLTEDFLLAAHVNSGHASWETMYRILRCRCYFPHLASACQQHVSHCARCAAANPQQGPVAPPTRADIPGRPWSEVVIDVLELGPDRSSRYHCVLACVDEFTKWIEVVVQVVGGKFRYKIGTSRWWTWRDVGDLHQAQWSLKQFMSSTTPSPRSVARNSLLLCLHGIVALPLKDHLLTCSKQQ